MIKRLRALDNLELVRGPHSGGHSVCTLWINQQMLPVDDQADCNVKHQQLSICLLVLWVRRGYKSISFRYFYIEDVCWCPIGRIWQPLRTMYPQIRWFSCFVDIPLVRKSAGLSAEGVNDQHLDGKFLKISITFWCTMELEWLPLFITCNMNWLSVHNSTGMRCWLAESKDWTILPSSSSDSSHQFQLR